MFTYFTIGLFVAAYLFLGWIRRYIRITDVTKKYVLITGCDTGFGHVLAQKLDMIGVHVIAACLTEPAQRRLKEVTSSRLRTVTLDVTNPESVRHAVDFVKAVLPDGEGLWGLVNNAGVLGSILGPPEWHHVEDFQHVLSVNTMGPVRTTLEFLPLIKQAKGRIVFMSSLAGRLASTYTMPYSMSKYAIESFADGLRVHLGFYEVSVHIIEPGAFQTNAMSKDAFKKGIQKGWDLSSISTKEEFGRDYLENLQTKMFEYSTTASTDLNKVTKAYVHALTARCPRIRYTVGMDMKFTLFLSYMPSCVQDFFLGKFMSKLIPAALK